MIRTHNPEQDAQDFINEQDERPEDRDAHENWLISEKLNEKNLTFEQLRDRFIEHYKNILI